MVTPGSTATQSSPLVSCILPTKNRAAFIPQAIASYQSQTYPNKELVIFDNGDDETEAILPTDLSIRYYRITGNRTTGEMRNFCAKYSKGEFICHFDSDDWSAPRRITDQVTRLGEHGVVTGYHAMLFYDERDGKLYWWRMPSHSAIRYALGTSLCYRRVWWHYHPFQALRIGEDMKFVQQALREAYRLVTTVSAEQLMVARVHHQQTSRKTLNPASYQPVSRTTLPQAFPCSSILSAT
jgi:glycosyltransferase involved in cell wall biosynthesis